jgi:uncharacterized protein YukE
MSMSTRSRLRGREQNISEKKSTGHKKEITKLKNVISDLKIECQKMQAEREVWQQEFINSFESKHEVWIQEVTDLKNMRDRLASEHQHQSENQQQIQKVQDGLAADLIDQYSEFELQKKEFHDMQEKENQVLKNEWEDINEIRDDLNTKIHDLLKLILIEGTHFEELCYKLQEKYKQLAGLGVDGSGTF